MIPITGQTLAGSEEVKCCHLVAGLFPMHITTCLLYPSIIHRPSLTGDIWWAKCGYIAVNYVGI